MQKKFLTVYQIYFSEEQKKQLVRGYVPFHNENCSVFFENEVIVNLIEQNAHLDSEYFGVVSYKLYDKVGDMRVKWKNIPNIANHSTNKFMPEMFERHLMLNKPDVMSFQRHQGHDPISFANRFHPKFSEYFAKIMFSIGYNWRPTHFEDVFYCNYFVAKSEIYHQFVHEMLIPAMNVMKTMPELMQNSGYPHKLRPELQQQWGVEHYPYHAFLCERMFSYFVYLKKLKCLHF